MKNLYLLSAFLLWTFPLSLISQVWEATDPGFPNPVQTWRITVVDENVAWTYGFTLDPEVPDGAEWTFSDYFISKTVDGGNSWQTYSFPQGAAGFLSNIASISADVAWVAYFDFDEGSKLLKTTDGGASWETLNIDLESFIGSVHFYNESDGIVLADPFEGEFQVFLTDDGGDTWTQIHQPDIPAALDDDEWMWPGMFTTHGDWIWSNTEYGRVLYSQDRGNTWSIFESPEGSEGQYSHHLASDDEGNLYFNFILIDPDTDEELGVLLFRRGLDDDEWTDITPENNENWIAGLSGVPGTGTMIMHIGNVDETWVSYDKGNSWTTIDDSHRVGFVSFFNESSGFTCEMPLSYNEPSRFVYRYVGSPLTGLLLQKPLNVSLSVFPNPVVNHLNVHFESENPGKFCILINDLKGKLMHKLDISETQSFTRLMDLSDYPNGVYILTLCNDAGMKSTKFLKF